MRDNNRRYAAHVNGHSISRVGRCDGAMIVRGNATSTGFALVDDTAGDNESAAADLRDMFLAGIRDGSIILKSRDTNATAREARIAAYEAMESQRAEQIPMRHLIGD